MAALGVGSGEDRAEAYRLYDNGAFDFIVPASEALRWSVDAWGPGRTLLWEIEDGPDWELLLDGAEDFTPLLEEALSEWSAVETADISWRVAGVAEPSAEDPRFGDSRHRVFFDSEARDWGAALWWVRSTSAHAWQIAECDVGFPGYWPRWLEDNDVSDADLQRIATSFLVREVGHCLGLAEPARLPSSNALRRSQDDEDSHWFSSAIRHAWPLSDDDRTGASLLRPRRGWLSTVGSLSGVLELDEGEPAPYVHVYALRLTADGLRNPIGAFSNGSGKVLIEGLPPGDYLLWAHPLSGFYTYAPLVANGAATNVKDAVLAHTVRVRADRVTDGVVIPMRSGRE